MLKQQSTVLTLRRLHRAAGILLALLLVVLTVSGTVLQTIMAIYGDTGPRQASGEPFWVLRLRDGAVTVHTGAFTGIGGVYVGAVCAVGLLFFAGSGVWMNLAAYRTRRAQGQHALFWWNRSSIARSMHRWLTLPVALFAALLAVTGASLDVYFAHYGIVPLPPPRSTPGGHAEPNALYDPPPSGGRLWHDLSLSVHKLNFLGGAGHVLGVVVGLAMLGLVLSGVVLLATMYRQRRRAGRTQWFW